jgi:hypothetical protein
MSCEQDSVLICTPVRDGRFHAGYVAGMMQSNGLHSGWTPKSGQSDIYMARNELMNHFYANKCYQTMVGIDSDIGFTRADLENLIASDGQLVSGIYTDKMQPPMPFCRDEKGENVPHKDIPPQGMIRSLLVPGGFFKLERSALDTVVERKLVRAYGTKEQRLYAFYATRFYEAPEGDHMVSEDYSLSLLLMHAGIMPWTNCGIRVNHDGRTWDGKILDNQT